MLAEPKRKVFALTSDQWKNTCPGKEKETVDIADGDISAEIWTYKPFNVGDSRCVDPLSLYLSFSDEVDERVEAALEELLEGVAW
jgi:hypothetical protein